MNVQKIILQFDPKRENLLPTLKAIQKENGFISQEAIQKVARFFSLKPSEVYSAASFYSELETRENFSGLTIRICDSANCGSKKSEKIIQEVEKFFGQKVDDLGQKVRIKRESCFGLCLSGPIMQVGETIFEKVTPEKVDDILKNYV